MTPEEVCDAVFGEYTRDDPTPRWLGSSLSHPWASLFDGPKPEHYVEPTKASYPEPVVWGWHTAAFG